MVSKYVFKRNEIYYFRLKIPLDLKQYFPVKEIWKSLKTRSLTTARTAVSKLLYQTERLFLYARSGMLSNERNQKNGGRLSTQNPGPQGADQGYSTTFLLCWWHSTQFIITQPAQAIELTEPVVLLSKVIAEHVNEAKLANAWTDDTVNQAYLGDT